ncbi:class I SAM-dependent DNA methyltransferase, partial [Vibrio sp. FNV 38]|nr:class I SAM-dependent DNA methyltransferase [Vibrio sp. FNV 38]
TGRKKKIYDGNDNVLEASNINGYLLDAPNVFIESRVKPLCNVLDIRKGNQPTDGGNLIIEGEDYADFIKSEPSAIHYIKRFVGAREYLNNIPRYCLWLVGVSPAQLKSMPKVMERVEKVRQMRLSSSDPGTHRLADTPT